MPTTYSDDGSPDGKNDSPAPYLLSQKSFRDLLLPLKKKDCVILAIIDLFDFDGSVLPELDEIVADNNNVILAVNKADLLPGKKVGQVRIESWVRKRLREMNVASVGSGERGGDVRLVSFKSGFGVKPLLRKVRQLSEGKDVYVVGAANAGKSTLLNRLLEMNNKKSEIDELRRDGNQRAGRSKKSNDKKKEAITTSPIPGTTLSFIKVEMVVEKKRGPLKSGAKKNFIIDTPGLLIPGSYTTLLPPEELRLLLPRTSVEPFTFRVGPGKSLYLGGLGSIGVTEDSKPFLLTVFCR